MIRRTIRLLAAALAATVLVPLGVATASAAPEGAAPTGAAADTCAVKSKPAGKVLQGYWENWDAPPTASTRPSAGPRSPTPRSAPTGTTSSTRPSR